MLVDAPCTGLGALRRRPEARWRRTPADLDLYARTKRAASRASQATGEHGMQYNARKQAVLREIHERAYAAAGLVPGPGTIPA